MGEGSLTLSNRQGLGGGGRGRRRRLCRASLLQRQVRERVYRAADIRLAIARAKHTKSRDSGKTSRDVLKPRAGSALTRTSRDALGQAKS